VRHDGADGEVDPALLCFDSLMIRALRQSVQRVALATCRLIAMLRVGAPSLNRDEALEVLEQLRAALLEVRRVRAPVDAR
jgi:hypothetical protein